MPNLLLSQYGRSSYMDPSLPLLPALSRAGRYGILPHPPLSGEQLFLAPGGTSGFAPYNIKRKLQHFAERREAEGLQGLQPALDK
jgi:hypothetical protein